MDWDDEIGNRDHKVIYKVPIISVFPSSHDFGSVDVGSYSDNSFLVQNTGGVDLVISSVSSPALPFSMLTENCSDQVLAVLETCSVDIRFEPAVSDGSIQTGSFNIDSNDPDDGIFTVNLSGTTPDLVPPEGSIVINNGDAFTTSTSVTLNLSATDLRGIADMCISNTATCPSWQPYDETPMAWTLPTGDEPKTVNAWFRDGSSNANESQTSSIITLDTTTPVDGSMSTSAGSGSIILNWSGFSDTLSGLDNYRLVYTTGSYSDQYCTNGTEIYLVLQENLWVK